MPWRAASLAFAAFWGGVLVLATRPRPPSSSFFLFEWKFEKSNKARPPCLTPPGLVSTAFHGAESTGLRCSPAQRMRGGTPEETSALAAAIVLKRAHRQTARSAERASERASQSNYPMRPPSHPQKRLERATDPQISLERNAPGRSTEKWRRRIGRKGAENKRGRVSLSSSFFFVVEEEKKLECSC